MIAAFTRDDIGRLVYYIHLNGTKDAGRLKYFNNHTKVALVVYNIGNSTDKEWQKLGATATDYYDLSLPAWA